MRGDSLERAGFRAGDTLAVRRQPEASDGDLVVARIGQQIMVRRLRRIDAGCVELQPESTNSSRAHHERCDGQRRCVELQPESTNPKHRSIHIDAQTKDSAIVGVVVGAVVGAQRTRRKEVDRGWEPDMGM